MESLTKLDLGSGAAVQPAKVEEIRAIQLSFLLMRASILSFTKYMPV